MSEISRRRFLQLQAGLGIGLSTGFLSLQAGRAFAQTPKKGGTLRAALNGGASTDRLDPASFNSYIPVAFGKTWGEYLVRVNRDGSLDYRLAEEVLPSSDAKEWTIRVRKGVEFHNGKTVTGDDVKETLARHASEKSQSGAYGFLKAIDTIKASGNDVKVTLKEANADFAYLLSDYHMVIQPNGGHDDPNAGISAGPYQVEQNQPGVRHSGKRFANYWNADRAGHADFVEILVVNDNTSRTSALKSGQVQLINQVPAQLAQLLKGDSALKLFSGTSRTFGEFNMFCDDAVFKNGDLRQALKLAIDRELILKNVFQGLGQVGNDYPINAAYPLFDHDLYFEKSPQTKYDPDQAKFLLKKSGFEGRLPLSVSDAAFSGATAAAQIFQQSAAAAGIQIDVVREPADGYWSEVWNAKPFHAAGWYGRPTQDQMYSTAYMSDAPWNDSRFKNEAFDKLILEAKGELDDAKRKLMYADAAKLVHDDGGSILFAFIDITDATSAGVQGYEPHPGGELMDGFALSECWVTE